MSGMQLRVTKRVLAAPVAALLALALIGLALLAQHQAASAQSPCSGVAVDSSGTVSWCAQNGATGYVVLWWRPDSSATDLGLQHATVSGGAVTSTTVSLEPNTSYEFAVFTDQFEMIGDLVTLSVPALVVSITGGSGITEGGTASFTISANPAPASDLEVSVNVSQSGDYGVTTGTQTVTIPTSGNTTLSIATGGDDVDETDGSVTVTLNDGDAYDVSATNGTATVAVLDDDDPATDDDQLPADHPLVKYAVLISDIKNTYIQDHDDVNAHPRWKRVLKAFGEPDYVDYHLDAMTSQEAQDLYDDNGWARWEPIGPALAYTENYQPTGTADPEITISGGSGITEGGTASFTITANPAPASAITVNVEASQTGSWGATGAATVTVSVASTTYTITTVDDQVDEADGSVTATVQSGSGYTVGAASSASVNVADDDDPPPATPEITISGGSGITEGGTASFTITASPAPASAITVNVGVSQTGSWSATGAATVTVSGASTTYTITTSDDEVDETDGSVTATVQSGTGYIVGSASAATVNVADDDGLPADHPLVKYATLIADIKDTYIQDHNDVNAHPKWKRVLKAFGEPDYADYHLDAMTSQEAQDLYNDNRWARWEHIGDALEYTENYHAGPEITISGGSGITEGGSAVFTLNANPAPAADLDVSVAVTASGDYGVTAGAQTVTIPAADSATLTIVTSDDQVDEADGSVTAMVQSGTGYTVGAASSATVAVSDDDPPPATPEITISGGAGITEGGTATFTISANPAPGSPITVNVEASQTGSWGATGAATVTVSVASTTYTITTVDDQVDEADGSVTATVQSGSGYTVGSASSASVNVADNDDAPVVVNPPPLEKYATLINDIKNTYIQDHNDVNAHTRWKRVLKAFGEPDYVDYPKDAMTSQEAQDLYDDNQWARWEPIGDALEYTENYHAGPEITISGGSGITEGGTASFTISANPAPHSAITVNVGVSQSGSWGATGASTVSVSGASTTYTITTGDDQVDEADGSVTATVQSGTGYTVGLASSASVNVADDDDPPPATPEITISGGSGITEGGTASFTITANPAPASAITVNVEASQTGSWGATGAATVSVSGATTTYTITTSDDQVDETDGSVTATVQSGDGYTVGSASAATVNVADDDVPEITIAGVRGIAEGGTATFTITASPAPASAITVNISVTEDGDFGATGAATVSVSGASTTYTITTTDDQVNEADGSVTATVQSGQGYIVGAASSATVAVSDDDVPGSATLSIEDASGTEGREVIFTVKLSEAVSHEVRVWYAPETAPGLGSPGVAMREEYWQATGWLVFKAGDTSRTATIFLNDDENNEPDEIFLVKLSKAEGAAIADGVATMTIIDDD